MPGRDRADSHDEHAPGPQPDAEAPGAPAEDDRPMMDGSGPEELEDDEL